MMRILLALTLSLTAAGWSSAFACSPPLERAITEKSYEEKLTPYLANKHRKIIDTSETILIGTFKYSKWKKAHRLSILETLKADPAKISQKRISVKFRHIDNDRVTYVNPKKRAQGNSRAANWFKPTSYPYGLEGSFGPGDCRISLEIFSNQNYLILADENFEISAMFSINESILPFQAAIQNMLDDPNEAYGVSFSLNQMLAQGTKIKLLETESCSPLPTFKTLDSSTSDEVGESFKSQPILIFDNFEDHYFYGLPEEVISQARERGLQQGRFVNTPQLSACKIGQKHLSLGSFLYARSSGYSGQIISEQDGVFNLKETAFEHHITPSEISLDQMLKLLEEHKLTEANPK